MKTLERLVAEKLLKIKAVKSVYMGFGLEVTDLL